VLKVADPATLKLKESGPSLLEVRVILKVPGIEPASAGLPSGVMLRTGRFTSFGGSVPNKVVVA